jgi:anti-sigma factor RsiW
MKDRPISEAELHAYVDSQLGPRDCAKVEAYLSTHPDDAASVAAFRAQNAALEAALGPVLDEPLPRRLKAEHWTLPVQRRSRLPRAIAASVVFAVGILFGAGAIKLTEHSSIWASSNDVGAAVARAAADAHRVFIPEILHPVEVEAARESHLLQWLSRRLGYPMGLPDLTEEGFSLIGGRLLPGSQGPAALFMYEKRDGTRLTLYCGKLQPIGDTAFRYSETDGVRTIYWISDNIGFAVTGPLERSVLQQLAQRFFVSMEQEPKRRS